MKVLIAMDSFKGTFTSMEVAAIVENGIRRVYKSAVIEKVAIADGGEGTVDAIVNSLRGELIYVAVSDPLGGKVKAKYGIVEGSTAIIEMAEASGLSLVPEDKRNPLVTSSIGTGQIIIDALNRGCKKIIMGIGGSATNDGGAGMAVALGIRLLDKNKNKIGLGGGALGSLDSIDLSELDPRVELADFLIACDVNNPLCGENGASKIFGPQKGATEEMIKVLDMNLEHFAQVIKTHTGKDVAKKPGAGAAGGLGAGLMAFCCAKLSNGADIVMDTVKLDDKIKNSDIVITGEGRVDGQTAYGKVPVGVALRGKKYNKPVFVIAGFADKGAELVYQQGVDAIISSIVGPMELKTAIEESPRLIEEASERLFRIIKAVRGDYL